MTYRTKSLSICFTATFTLLAMPVLGQGEMNVEYDVVDMPSHWVSPAPMGKGAGPVTDDMLRKSGSYTDK